MPNAQAARNVILSDDTVREFVAAAYRAGDKFGLLTDMLAVTGARPSQAVRLRVEDAPSSGAAKVDDAEVGQGGDLRWGKS